MAFRENNSKGSIHKASVALRQLINDPSVNVEEAKHFYIEIYMHTYRARFTNDTMNGTLPNEQTRQVQNAAHSDAKNDKQDNRQLSEVELAYQAVIRIQEIFVYETRASTGYLTHIMGYVPRYKEAYEEKQDRPTRSAPSSFLPSCAGSFSPLQDSLSLILERSAAQAQKVRRALKIPRIGDVSFALPM